MWLELKLKSTVNRRLSLFLSSSDSGWMLRHAVIAFSNVRYRIFKNVFLKVAIWPPFRLQNYKKYQYGFQKGEKNQSPPVTFFSRSRMAADCSSGTII
jgi:hypothetical protein